MLKTSKSAFLAKSALFGFVAVMSLPESANAGFFDDLFGGLQQAPAQVERYADPRFASPDDAAPRMITRPRRVVEDDKPVLQKTTDLWHDKTLRRGDAVMMKDGLHIYDGPEAARHNAAEFTRLGATRDLAPKARMALVAMDVSRHHPLKSGATPDTIASGRSAAVASAIVAGYKITDAKGRSIRYVGP